MDQGGWGNFTGPTICMAKKHMMVYRIEGRRRLIREFELAGGKVEDERGVNPDGIEYWYCINSDF